MEIDTVLDLLTHYPRRYVDRSNHVAIDELLVDEEAMVVARIEAITLRRLAGRRSLVEMTVRDEAGSLRCSFFNQPWRTHQLTRGQEVIVFGKPELYRGRLQMVNPLVDLAGDQTGRIVPIYPQSAKAGVGSLQLASYITEALERAGPLADPLEDQFRDRLELIERTRAFRGIHAPQSWAERELARRRLAFDELWRLQLIFVIAKAESERTTRGIAHDTTNLASALRGAGQCSSSLVQRFLARLPFGLTAAQQRTILEIAADLRAPHPMHRLLQGDVGAGKTIVALTTLLVAIENGHQAALMVPTEVLAEQHELSARALLGDLTVTDERCLGGNRPIEIALLTSGASATERARIRSRLAEGGIDLVIGTHALLTEGVAFGSLGAVVIDEQHRFGVEQRAALRAKSNLGGSASGPARPGTGGREGHGARDGGEESGPARLAGGCAPDVLVMTATPIPRTAAMTVYGDLDMSVLDELPAGRRQIETIWCRDDQGEAAVWTAVAGELSAGRQAFIVCPRIDGEPGDGEPGDEDRGGEEDWGGEEWATERDRSDDGPRSATVRLAPPVARRPPASVVEEHARLSVGPLAGFSVGVLHGRLPEGQREATMAAFRSGELQSLVATTIVEVGIDVPNATVMVILSADRFGVAQLHQLRGRVGRGVHRSVCYLVAKEPTPQASARLEALVSSNDGFELAEIDLELRGEGTVLGIRQKGRNDLKLASLRRDRDLVAQAREVAEAVLAGDPDLARSELLRDELRLFVSEEEEEFLFKS